MDAPTLAWQVAVGAALARATTVRLADGVLTVRAADPRWVTEIEAARDTVLRRLQDLLGPDAVEVGVDRGPRPGNQGTPNGCA